MKPITAILCLFIVGCSTSSLERDGWVPPKPQSSSSMTVSGGGFTAAKGQKSMDMFLSVNVRSVPTGANYLRIQFPDPASKAPRESRYLKLSGPKEYRATSSPIPKLKYLEAYPVVIQLCSDRDGGQVIEQMTQQVRFELPPAVQAQLGVNQ
jgi:hypothetical protein